MRIPKSNSRRLTLLLACVASLFSTLTYADKATVQLGAYISCCGGPIILSGPGGTINGFAGQMNLPYYYWEAFVYPGATYTMTIFSPDHNLDDASGGITPSC